MTNIPAGWYPDPSGTTQQRWWDGAQWTEHYTPGADAAASVAPSGFPVAPQPYSLQDTVGVPTAPAGTQPYTPWIWVLALLPIVGIVSSIVSIFTTDIEALANPANTANPFGYTTADIVSRLVGWVVIGLSILFGILDHRALVRRGVPRPFHWAFIFFSIIGAPVYMIGRSIVVRRRVGSGFVPMIVNIALIVVGFVVGIIFAGSLFVQMFSSELGS